MCVAAIAWAMHPRWPLVGIGNRDEFHDRPTAPLAAWDDGSGIVAGRDLRSGGTWLGIAPERGRFALVTNVRNPDGPDPAKASRGGLVTDMLLGGDPASIAAEAFNPFNLLVASPSGLAFVSNRPAPQHRALPAGIYGLSNGALDEPWPKTLALKAALAAWLALDAPDLAPLFAALTKGREPVTPLAPEAITDITAPWTTPPFIHHPTYGTRCATVITLDVEGCFTIEERRFAAFGVASGETTLHLAKLAIGPPSRDQGSTP